MEGPTMRGRVMLAAAVLTWAAVGLPYWLFGWNRVFGPATGPVPEGLIALWVVGHVGFLVAFFVGHRVGSAGGPRWACVLLLALQTVGALAATAAFGDALQAALLVIVATQTVLLFRLRGAMVWLAVQSAALVLILSFDEGVWEALAISAAFVGFQLFAVMAVTMAEREAAARRELALTNAELEAARELLAESSRATERLRISRELHDGLGHHLTALSLQLEVAAHLGDGATAEPVARARRIAGRILEDLRRTVRTLREEPPADLAASLEQLAEGIPRPRVHLTAPPRLAVEDPVRANALVRSIQELITNAVRHSGASNLWLDLRSGGGWIEVAARDDGAGAARFSPGSGLVGMRERVEALGGTLDVDPAPGEGFRSRLRLPLAGPGPGPEPGAGRGSKAGSEPAAGCGVEGRA